MTTGEDEHRVDTDSGLETSHPDIDSILEMHIGSGDFCYKTRTENGVTKHLVKQLKRNQWRVHLSINDDEVKNFEAEELATFLILQVKMNHALKRRVIALILLFVVVAAPIMALSIVLLGIGATDDFEKFLIAGGVTVAFIPVACILMSGAERSVDKGLYQSRPNFIQVLQKMMELKETPYQKSAIQERIDRLQRHGIDTW